MSGIFSRAGLFSCRTTMYPAARHPRQRFSWRTFACAALVLAYFGFVGEAIHCQYFADTHHEHGESSSKPISHAAHCLAANHGTTAAIHSAPVAHDPPVQQSAFLVSPGETTDDSGLTLSTTARGPPVS